MLSDDEAETRNQGHLLERARSSRTSPHRTAFREALTEKPSPSAWRPRKSPVLHGTIQPSADVVIIAGTPVYDDRSLREYYDEADGDDEPLSETSSVDETELAAALNTPAPAVATSPLKGLTLFLKTAEVAVSLGRDAACRVRHLSRRRRVRPNCYRGMRRSWRSSASKTWRRGEVKEGRVRVL